MADPRFFVRRGPYTLSQLAEIGEASIAEDADAELEIIDVAPLETAGQGELSFLDNRKYLSAFSATKAAACIVHADLAAAAPKGASLLLSEAPYRSFALVSRAFYPMVERSPGISPAATVDETARIAATAQIAAGVVVEANAEIGDRCRIDANAVIASGSVIGDDTWIGAGASLSHCIIGQRVKIYPGARVGQDGFGFAMDRRGHVRVPQLGRVIIEDDSEIGANTTIDRGAGPDTVIGRGCMIDNLVQIAHNVEIGAGSVIVAQVGIAGSTKLGEFAVIAGQAGIGGHLKIGAGARVAAAAAVMRDVPPGQQVCGAPAVPIREFWRRYARYEKLTEGKG